MRPKVIDGQDKWQFAVFDPDHPSVAIDYVRSRTDGPTSLWLEVGGVHNSKPIGRLRGLPGIHEVLHVHAMGESWDDLSAVNELQQLKSLNIGFSKSRFDFAKVPDIEAVTGVWSPSWSNLHAARRLKVFAVSAYGASGFELPNAGALEDIRLIQPRFTTLAGFEACGSLEGLEISHASKLSNIDALAALTSRLRRLELHTCRRIGSYTVLAGLTSLEALRITNCSPVPSIRFVTGLSNLKVLGMVDTLIADGDLTAALNHSRLHHFYGDNKRAYRPPLREVQARLASRRSDA